MKPISISEFEIEKEHALILDLRNKNVFENGFITNSINIGIDGDYRTSLESLIEKDRKLIIVCTEKIEKECINILTKLGYTNIVGWLDGGYETWRKANNKIDMIISIEADEFATDFHFLKENETIIDIRTFEERKIDSIENSISIPLDEILNRIEDLTLSNSYYIFGIDGYSAMVAASLLKSKGFQLVKPIDSSYVEIKEALQYHKKV